MTPELFVMPVLVTAAVLLVLFAFSARRRLDDLDPRAGKILYEDVAKPALPGVAQGGEQLGSEPQLYYVDNEFRVAPNGVPTEVTLILMGKSDRIVRKRDGAIHVIDYKSGRRTDEKVDYYRYQLIAYFFMVEQTYGERPKKAIIDFLEDLDYAEIEDNEETRADCMRLIREMCEVKLGAIPDRLLADLDKVEADEPVPPDEVERALLS